MIRKPIPASEGPGSRYGGWQRSVTSEMQALRADVSGLVRRLVSPTRPGVPCAFRATKVFEPDRSSSFAVDVLQTNGATSLCNFVVKSGQPYEIPIRVDAEGVFVAQRLSVSMSQRFWDPLLGASQIPGSLLTYTMRNLALTNGVNWTTKFSLIPRQQQAALQFMWNIRDDHTGRRYSDFMMPAAPLGFNAFGFSGLQASPAAVVDNGLFTFACPWLFERDSNATFTLFPTSDVYQYDSSVSGTDASPGPALAFDDREGGIRTQSFTVNVELHGYRYKTSQDAIRAGALTRY